MSGDQIFISEPIQPLGPERDTSTMSRGLVGLPRAFTWRGQTLEIAAIRDRAKVTMPERHKAGNEVYLKRESFEIELADGRIASIYFERQSRGGSRKQRWFLYTISALEPDFGDSDA